MLGTSAFKVSQNSGIMVEAGAENGTTPKAKSIIPLYWDISKALILLSPGFNGGNKQTFET